MEDGLQRLKLLEKLVDARLRKRVGDLLDAVRRKVRRRVRLFLLLVEHEALHGSQHDDRAEKHDMQDERHDAPEQVLAPAPALALADLV